MDIITLEILAVLQTKKLERTFHFNDKLSKLKINMIILYQNQNYIEGREKNGTKTYEKIDITQTDFINSGEFNNLMQQMIIFIFVELWKKSTNDLH